MIDTYTALLLLARKYACDPESVAPAEIIEAWQFWRDTEPPRHRRMFVNLPVEARRVILAFQVDQFLDAAGKDSSNVENQ